ncbi:CS1 type fimbrial major subunit [Pseudomonas sp. Pseusp3]|uniref:CS1 type fimbrial major subunit n=1 Tax=unclassified Pseudomonas TaxID=196821 RepID=UPI0039AED294
MFKKIAMSSSVLALAFASSAALAVPQTHDIQVIADVPSTDFYVQPVDHGTVTQPQRLVWNDTTSELEGISRDFKAKSAAVGGTGNPAIKATLLDPVGMTSGGETIDLQVRFNNIALVKDTAVDVVNADAAVTEIIAPMQITPVKPGAGYKEGNYAGIVRVMFDAP